MVHTDLKFFTNEPERDLYSRFAAILKSNTQFFDVLVGYFRASGFFKMYEALEQVEKIRILVGLNVDRYTVKIIDRVNDEAKYAAISTADGKEMISDEIEKEFETAASSAQVEKGVRVFMDWLKSGKLEMRMYTEAPIHAKVYIMRKDQDKVPDTFGSVITGSSNFSEAGLVNNLEFNVELKDYADVKFALDKFEELWAQGTDIRDTYIEAVEQHTWMRDDITPYQLYLKTLYEFFKEEINADANLSLPKDTFLSALATMRSRAIFCSIIVQNMAQLKAMYKDDWESLVGLCDEFLYLGGTEKETHKYVSELLGKETISTTSYNQSKGRSGNYSINHQQSGRDLMTPDEVRLLDNSKCILFIRGELPVVDLKYNLLKHPNIRYTEDGGAAPYDYTAADNAWDDLPGAPENYELLDMDYFLPVEAAEIKPTIQRIRRPK